MTGDVGLLAAFAAGVVSFLAPCVLPIVPAYVAIITGLDVEQLREADRPLARIARDTGLFVAGFSWKTAGQLRRVVASSALTEG
ncbi:MAG: cytochrome c biogenesis CcdA family protein [Acidimicrobiales bacterium]